MKTRYVHELNIHHEDKSPNEIVPILQKIFNPTSVVDIGCGVGNFLREFKAKGVETITGIDGAWADKEEISRNIQFDNFEEWDLTKEWQPEVIYDLAISLEVAEHIEPEFADTFVKTLTNCSDNIVFSAAVPGQGGQNHINEQWNDYWIEKFAEKGFVKIDFLKPYFWNNKDIFWWYKQNILFFTKTPEKYAQFQDNGLFNIVHKDLFQKVVRDYENISTGKYPWRFYVHQLLNKLRGN